MDPIEYMTAYSLNVCVKNINESVGLNFRAIVTTTADDTLIFWIFFFFWYFSEKISLEVSYELSVQQTIHMKCCLLFSKKNISFTDHLLQICFLRTVLTFNTLWANSAEDKLIIFLPENQALTFQANYLLSRQFA